MRWTAGQALAALFRAHNACFKERFRFMAKGTFGERLKRERDLREVTSEEVAKATRISPRFLEALENENWDKLPGGVFGRGFVRTIARYLGLDEENLLAEYDLARGDQLAPSPSKPEDRIPSPPRWIPIVIALAVLLVILGLVVGGIYFWRARKKAKTSTLAPSAITLPQATAARNISTRPSARDVTGDSSLAALDLSISASMPVRATVLADDVLAFDGQLAGEDTRHFKARNSFKVTASDSSAVLLELNGQAMPPLGDPGTSGTMVLSRKDLKQAASGNPQP